MSEKSATPTVLSFDSSLLECPICFKSYAEVDPTTFLCGHSCCITDARKLTQCCLCKAQIPMRHSVSISLRDIAQNLLKRKDSTEAFPKGILKVESYLRNSPTFPLTQYPSQQNAIELMSSRVNGPMNPNAPIFHRAVRPASNVQMGAYPYTPPPNQQHHGHRRPVHHPPPGMMSHPPPGLIPPPVGGGLYMMSGVPPSPNMILSPDGSMYLPTPCPYMAQGRQFAPVPYQSLPPSPYQDVPPPYPTAVYPTFAVFHPGFAPMQSNSNDNNYNNNNNNVNNNEYYARRG